MNRDGLLPPDTSRDVEADEAFARDERARRQARPRPARGIRYVPREHVARHVPKGALALLAAMERRANARGILQINRAQRDEIRTEIDASPRDVYLWLELLERCGAIKRAGPPKYRVALVLVGCSKTAPSKGCLNCLQPVPKNGIATSNLCPTCKRHLGRQDEQWKANAIDLAILGKTDAEIHVALAALGTPRSLCGDAESDSESDHTRASDTGKGAYGIIQLLVHHGLRPRSALRVCEARLGRSAEDW